MAKRKNATLAATAYLIFFLPLMVSKRKDEFLGYHVRQGAWLFVVALALQGFLSLWAHFSLPLVFALRGLIRIALIALVTSGVITAVRSEEKPLPVIGKYAPKFF